MAADYTFHAFICVRDLSELEHLGNQFPSMLVVLRSNQADGESALFHTQKAKGRADKSGIRAKYRMYFWYELEEMGFSGSDLKLKLAQNRLHVPDNYERTVEMIGVLLTQNDIDHLRETAPEFASWAKGRQDRKINTLSLKNS